MSDKQPLGPNQTFWLQELRSGKYEQGRTDLCRNNKYCCLGVAAEIFKTEQTKIHILKTLTDSENEVFVKYFDGSIASAPNYVIHYLGLYKDLGETQSLTFDENALANMNDQGKTFSEIADIIEQDPSVYFQEPR